MLCKSEPRDTRGHILAREGYGLESGFLCGMENFAEVWRRVRGEAAPPCGEGTGNGLDALLRQRMDEKHAQAHFYVSLAKHCVPEAQGTLMKLCSAEKRHFRCLQLEYFLLTGRCHTPAESCACKACLLHGLRLARERELESAQQFRKDASVAQGTLRETLNCIAQEDEKHAQLLYGLLRRQIVDK